MRGVVIDLQAAALQMAAARTLGAAARRANPRTRERLQQLAAEFRARAAMAELRRA
jgi:hypothetical protein